MSLESKWSILCFYLRYIFENILKENEVVEGDLSYYKFITSFCPQLV